MGPSKGYLTGTGKANPNLRVTFTTPQHYQQDSPLLESGLIGPVVLRAAVQKAVPELMKAR